MTVQRPPVPDTATNGAGRAADPLRGLGDALVDVQAASTVHEVLRAVADSACAIVGGALAACSLTDPEDARQTAVTVATDGSIDPGLVPRQSPLYDTVIASTDVVRLEGKSLREHIGEPAEGLSPMVWLIAPLTARDGSSIGVLQVAGSDASAFDELDESVLLQLARIAAVGIEGIRLHEAQARQEAARFRDELLAGMSHDMQTPLSVIVGIADSLAEDPELPLEERRNIYPVIARQARRLRSLVNQFLDFSRIEADRPLTLDLQPTDVVEVIDSVVPLFTHQREVIVGAEDGLPPVLADRERFEQILVNLISNAVKYSEEPVRVVARWDGPDVIVDVVDEGPGLGEGELERIFEKFHRGSTADGVRGTGLGLYISRALAEAQGGKLLAISRNGLGSRFRVVLEPLTVERDGTGV